VACRISQVIIIDKIRFHGYYHLKKFDAKVIHISKRINNE